MRFSLLTAFSAVAMAACGEPIPAVEYRPPSADLPPWFGDAGAPPRRIAGRLYGGAAPLAGTVSLRMHAPDPSAWIGLDVVAAADGAFDFGSLRAGHYMIVARASGRSSRVVDVDTRTAAADALEVYAYPCPDEEWTLVDRDTPVAGAIAEVAGVRVATSDAMGRITLCERLPLRAVIRAPGHASEQLLVAAHFERPRAAELSRAGTVTGVVIGMDGAPLAGAAVQPASAERRDHHSSHPAWPVQATTDANGRFTLSGVHHLEYRQRHQIHEPFPFRRIAPPQLAVYEFVVWTADRRWVVTTMARPGDPSVRLALNDFRPLPAVAAPTTRRARISGRIRLAGAPLVDAEVAEPGLNENGIVAGPDATHTRRDGSFDLVLARDHLFTRGSGARTIELTVRHDASPARTARLVSIAPGQHIDDLIIDIAGMGSIAGTVHRHDSTPVAHATVEITPRGTGVEHRRSTRADGAFRFPFEVARTYDLAISEQGGAPVHAVASLSSAAPDATLRLVLPPPPHQAGIVVDAAGAPVPAAAVAVSGAGLVERTPDDLPVGWPRTSARLLPDRTDASGRFDWLADVRAPTAIVAAVADGRIGLAELTRPGEPVTVVVGPAGSLRIECAAEASVVTIVRGALAIEASCGDVVADVVPGRYQVTGVHTAGFSHAAATVRAGDTVTATLRPTPPAAYTASVRSYPGDRPIAGVLCSIRWSTGFEYGVPHARSDADGRVAFAISPGVVELRCQGNGDHSDGLTRVDLATAPEPTVYLVPRLVHGTDAGAELTAEPRGARITAVHGLAAEAGLRIGDLVLAANNIALAPLGRDAMHALAFRIPPTGTTTWTIDRGGRRLALRTSIAQ
jgi:hypothetical protein